jgi:hypothetical protein
MLSSYRRRPCSRTPRNPLRGAAGRRAAGAIGIENFVVDNLSVGFDAEASYGDDKGYGATTLTETPIPSAAQCAARGPGSSSESFTTRWTSISIFPSPNSALHGKIVEAMR